MRKPRINVHIRPETCRRLDLATERPGVSKAAVVDAALSAFLSPEHDDQRDAAILKRLDRLGRKLETLARDQAIATETLSLFVRYYLTITPPLPQTDKDAARALGKERYAYFETRLARRLAAGKSVSRELTETITAAASDFFTAADPADGEDDAGTEGDTGAEGPAATMGPDLDGDTGESHDEAEGAGVRQDARPRVQR